VTDIILTMRDPDHLYDTMKQLSSEHGGAWIARRIGFSLNFEFTRYQNPSSVPDCEYDLVGRELAWKGQIRGFTPGAIEREANRGLNHY